LPDDAPSAVPRTSTPLTGTGTAVGAREADRLASAFLADEFAMAAPGTPGVFAR